MSIRGNFGKPGGGKGMNVTRLAIQEIRWGTRPIISSFPFKIDPWLLPTGKKKKPFIVEQGMKSYLAHEYNYHENLHKRIFTIADEENADFFLWRVIDGKLVKLDCKRDDKGRMVEYDGEALMKAGPCFYIVAEAYNYFNARRWKDTGEGVLNYFAQHRHFGDEVIIDTQSVKQIDSVLRSLCQDYSVCTNHGKMKLGMFRQPEMFSVAVFDSPPLGSVEPMERKIYKQDFTGLGSCYDTTGGAGIQGGGAGDFGEKAKGLPWWAIFGLMLLIAALVWFVVKAAGWGVGKAVAMPSSPVQTAMSNGIASTLPRSNKARKENTKENPTEAATVNQSEKTNRVPERLTSSGYVVVDGRLRFYVSNGEILTGDEVYSIQENYAITKFGKVWFDHPKPGQWPERTETDAPITTVEPSTRPVKVTPSEHWKQYPPRIGDASRSAASP